MGVPVIDTDLIARELVEPGMPALNSIIEMFGSDLLLEDGRLDRSKLRSIIIHDDKEKKALENILHPLIANEVRHRVDRIFAPYIIIVVPLYRPSSNYDWADCVVVVDVPVEVQIKRVMKRDSVSEEEALAIIGAQTSRDERLDMADIVLKNERSLGALKRQTHKLHERLSKLASDSKER
jgi:dephospho-CoA kinase